MKTHKNLLSSILAAVMVSGAFVGTTFADDPNDTVGGWNGDYALSIHQMKIANEKALRAARENPPLIVKPLSDAELAAYADFPDQAFGDLNGNQPVPIRRQARDNAAASQNSFLILPFQGDWNGTARKGSPRR